MDNTNPIRDEEGNIVSDEQQAAEQLQGIDRQVNNTPVVPQYGKTLEDEKQRRMQESRNMGVPAVVDRMAGINMNDASLDG